MLDVIIVLGLVIAAVVAAGIIWSYRRFVETRSRLIEHMKNAAPEMIAIGPTDAGFAVSMLGTDVEVDLATLLRRRPARIAERDWFDRVIDDLRTRVPVPEAPPYLLIRDRIVPQLKPTSYVEVFERYPLPLRLVWRPFVPGVAITYVVNNPHDRVLVTARTLEVWGEAPEALHALAVTNLRAHTAHLLTELGGPQRRYEHLDGLDATRILVADLVVPPGIDEPVIAIPEETVMLVAPALDRAALAAETAARYGAATRPICSHVFQVTAAGLVLLDARPTRSA
jgi:hypothetical protein